VAKKETFPATVDIFGMEYTVCHQPMKSNVYGLCDNDGKEISVDNQTAADVQENTLLHETLHALFYRSGWSMALGGEVEEALVHMIQQGLTHAGFGYRRQP
jgi:hypothetical protein